MITLTGKETKLELQQICDLNQINYSKLDSKDILLQKIKELDEILSESEKSIFNKMHSTMIKVTTDGSLREITGSQYCNIKGYNNRTKFFIEKKYEQEYFSIEQWDEIFKKERLI